MTARDAAAGLGGVAAELADTANKVYTAQPAAVGDLGAKFTAAVTAGADSVSEVDGSVKRLDGAWQGASADAFVGYMAAFTKAGAALTEALTAASADLGAAAAGLQAARDALEGVFGELYDSATKWLSANPDATADERRRHVDSLAAGYRGRVSAQVDGAERAVATAAAALAGRADALRPGFAALPDPGTQAFTPAPGKPVEWTPTPAGATAPSGADPAAKSATARPPASQSSGGSAGSGGVDSGSSRGGGGVAGGGGLGAGGGPPAAPPPGNVQEWIKEAIAELRARGIAVTEADAQLIWEIIQHESGGNPNAVNNWDCLTTDAAILTRRGWLKHDEVRAGDETIGVDLGTGRSGWTRVSAVHHYADAPLVTLSDSRWSATTTPNHRWVALRAAAAERTACSWSSGVRAPAAPTEAERGFVSTSEIDTGSRVLLAAPAETGTALDVSDAEAAVLGWIARDGYLGSRHGDPSTSTAPSMPAAAVAPRALPAGVPHSVSVDAGPGEARGPRRPFRLDRPQAADLLRRAGDPKADAVEQVLAMSTAQRAAWLAAITDAGANAAGRCAHQAPGAVLEAITLAVYLSGERPRVSRPGTWAAEFRVRSSTPVVTGRSLRKADAGRGPVWCVTTDSGTWTARDGDDVFLTGNSNAAKGTPSKGLMQCIDPTFQSYKVAGHDDIWNPVDNICAGVNYAISRYGSLANVPGIKATRGGGGYVGY